MIAISINQSIFVVKENISILEACKMVGIEIPRFCYHEALSVAGNCRMCLVKLEDDEKLIISCLTEILPDMSILTDDPVIQKAREDVIEFLLLDHPLDCPICDQAGECDLQDQVRKYGAITSKYNFKRVDVIDKYFSPFIKSIMSRCIHCTRCVRFSSEIAGVDFFGTLNRGNSTEIGTYALNLFKSEISGNVVDLCPVGALTSKSYAFKARPWEAITREYIDLTDALGSNIYVNYTLQTDEILRVLPKYNKEINENLISDKVRYSYDACYSFNRLLRVEFRFFNGENAIPKKHLPNMERSSTALSSIFNNTSKQGKILVIAPENSNVATLNLAKRGTFLRENINFCLSTKSENPFTHSNRVSNISFHYPNTIKNVSDALNSIFLLAINPRTEAALINARLRFLVFNDYTTVYNFGYNHESNLKTLFLNFKISSLIENILKGRQTSLLSLFINSASPLILCGNSLIERGVDINQIEFFLKKINPSLIFFKVYLHSNSTFASFLNLKPLNRKLIKEARVFYFLNCRETNFLKRHFFNKNRFSPWVMWINSFKLNEQVKRSAQYLVPLDYEEKTIFLNLESRPQYASNFLRYRGGNTLTYKNFFQRAYRKMQAAPYTNAQLFDIIVEALENPEKFELNETHNKHHLSNYHLLNLGVASYTIFSNYPVKPQYLDFYRTNSFTDASKNMIEASAVFNKAKTNFI